MGALSSHMRFLTCNRRWIIPLAIVSLALSGCAGFKAIRDDNQSLPSNSVLVVLRYDAPSGCLVFAADAIGRNYIAPISLAGRTLHRKGDLPNYVMLRLEPGKEYLATRFYHNDCGGNFFYQLEPKPLEIHAEAGTITYIGDIKISEPQANGAGVAVMIAVVDNEKMTVDRFRHDFPKTFAKFAYRKSIAKFYETEKSYAEPEFRKATYDSIKLASAPIPARVDVRFEVNGAHAPKVDAQLRRAVVKVLAESKVLTPSTNQNSVAVLEVVANNIADVDGAKKQGQKLGVALGLSGVTVVDYYEFTCTYWPPGGGKHEARNRHAIRSVVGKVPEELRTVEFMSTEKSFDVVVEDVLLNCFAEWQAADLL